MNSTNVVMIILILCDFFFFFFSPGTTTVTRIAFHYGNPREMYHSGPNEGRLDFICILPHLLSDKLLAYESRASTRKVCTLWEYALRLTGSFMKPSLSRMREKMKRAVELALAEDPDFEQLLLSTK